MWLLAAVSLLATVAVLYAFRVRRLNTHQGKLTAVIDARNAELLELTRQLQIANTALQEMATVDSTTGLANRRRFVVFIQQEWQRSTRTRLPLSLMLVDIDHFKKFNDRYGHPAGDDCIRQVSAVLQAAAHRVTDLCARYGGEEFAIVLVDTDSEGALTVAETIRTGVERLRLTHADSPTGSVTVSIGVATRTGDTYASVRDLISACDDALYRVKEEGRNDTETDR